MGHIMAMGLEMDMVWGQPWGQGWSESRDGHGCGIEVAMGPRMAVWWLWDQRWLWDQGWPWDQKWSWDGDGCGTRDGDEVAMGPKTDVG